MDKKQLINSGKKIHHLERENFRLQHLNESKRQDVVSLKLNKDERHWLNKQKVVLQQEKDATAVKQLARIGAEVIHSSPQGIFFKTVLDNLRKNKRLGIAEVEEK